MAVRSACAAPARTGTVTCAMLHGRRAGRCFMHWRFQSCLVWRWGTQNSPAPPRRGMPCRSACGSTSTSAGAVCDFAGRKRAFPPTQAEIDRYPPVTHPIVRTHPVTRRKCVYVMRDDCTGIEGMEGGEAETLIAALADHIVKPAFVYRHQWRVGDLLMWDNCTVQHRAIQDYDLPQRRLMHRTTMGGTVPV